MNISFFIARKLMVEKSPQSNGKGSGFSKLIINLAMSAVCISVMVMIIAIAIVKGYQQEVRNKIIGFNANIQLTHLDLNNSYESIPVERDSLMERLCFKQENVKFIQKYATKAGIIKTDESFEGIVLKGVDADYNWDFLKKHLLYGNILTIYSLETSNQILVSNITAKRMKLRLGDAVYMYFIQDPPRVRKFKIIGIFDTGMGDLDEIYAFADIKQVQKLNNWQANQISGYEIGITQLTETENVREALAGLVPYAMGISTIFDMYPALFDWLGLLDMNVVIIIILMIAVAAINMITALLILILERTQMIGILKALGSTDTQVSKIFLYMASNIIVKGLIIGNILGVSLCYLQMQYSFFKLDQSSYYLDTVPIELIWTDIVFINIGSFLVCLLILLIPSRFVSRINPVKTIKFN